MSKHINDNLVGAVADTATDPQTAAGDYYTAHELGKTVQITQEHNS